MSGPNLCSGTQTRNIKGNHTQLTKHQTSKNRSRSHLHQHECIVHLFVKRRNPTTTITNNTKNSSRSHRGNVSNSWHARHLRTRLIWTLLNLASSTPHLTARRASLFSSLRLFLCRLLPSSLLFSLASSSGCRVLGGLSALRRKEVENDELGMKS